MTSLLLEEIPIEGTGQVVQLNETPKTFGDLGITIDGNAKFLRFYYDPSAVEVLARYTHDGNDFTVTADEGIPVASLDIHLFNTHMFARAKHRTVSGTVDVYVEQFNTE